MVVEKSIRLVIIDSIALIARADPSNSIVDRQAFLGIKDDLLGCLCPIQPRSCKDLLKMRLTAQGFPGMLLFLED